MTRSVTLAGYGLLIAVMAAYQLLGLVRRRTPTVGQAVALLTRRPGGRALVLLAWLWLGWHVFVRAS